MKGQVLQDWQQQSNRLPRQMGARNGEEAITQYLIGLTQVVSGVIADLQERATSCQKKVKVRQKYLNNIVEQDDQGLKRLVKPGMDLARSTRHWRTIKGYEMMNMMQRQIEKVRKGAVRNMSIHASNFE